MSDADRGAARLLALRTLAEGSTATIDLLAKVSGRSPRALRKRAEVEGWVLERPCREDVAMRVRAVAAVLLDKVEVLGRQATEAGGRIDKGEIEGLIAMIRGLDKIGEIMRPDEAVKENQIKQNEDLAGVLDRINDRIIEFATQLAAQMAAGQSRAGASQGGEG